IGQYIVMIFVSLYLLNFFARVAWSGYRENAERIREDFARHDPSAEAAALLERLAWTGAPVLRQ
ncbi:MAG: hypothetical protein ACLQCB_20780, partial [Spirochaetia bacterium]